MYILPNSNGGNVCQDSQVAGQSKTARQQTLGWRTDLYTSDNCLRDGNNPGSEGTDKLVMELVDIMFKQTASQSRHDWRASSQVAKATIKRSCLITTFLHNDYLSILHYNWWFYNERWTPKGITLENISCKKWSIVYRNRVTELQLARNWEVR